MAKILANISMLHTKVQLCVLLYMNTNAKIEIGLGDKTTKSFFPFDLDKGPRGKITILYFLIIIFFGYQGSKKFVSILLILKII